MKLLSCKKKLNGLTLSLYEIHQALEATNIKKDWKAQIPQEYHKFLDSFREKLPGALPPHRTYNHKIHLMDGKEPSFGPLYGMS